MINSPTQIRRAIKSEISEMAEIVQEEQRFYLQDNPQYFGIMTFVQFKKFSWGYGYTVIDWVMGTDEIITWNEGFGRCSKCRSIVTMEENSSRCNHCESEWFPL